MISVVIPALNEEKAIERCLRSVLLQKCSAPPEIRVVDGDSRDSTVAIAERILDSVPGAKILSCRPGRGIQMNAGAASATGDILFFLHADTVLTEGSLEAIENALRWRTIDAGCFHHRFDGRSPLLRLISILHDFRFSCSKTIYGDQGLFIRRRLFFELGGFKEDRVMEDVEFSERLLKRTRPIRLPMPVITSSRKFEAIGPLRALFQVVRLLIGYELGRRNPSTHMFFQNSR